MGSWFRSEDMCYVSIIVNEDAAHPCISDLGKLGMIQFTDLNPELTAFQRRYVAYMKRIDELERKLSFFANEVSPSSIGLHKSRVAEGAVRNQVRREHDSLRPYFLFHKVACLESSYIGAEIDDHEPRDGGKAPEQPYLDL